MKVFLTHDQKMQFSVENQKGFSLPIDAAKSMGGNEEGFRPMELVLGALIACTSVDVLLILNKYRKKYSDYRVESEGTRKDEIPAVFNRIDLAYHLKSEELSADQFYRAVELALTKYCSVAKMIIPEVKISARIIINSSLDYRIINT